jgi:hypothetical protein
MVARPVVCARPAAWAIAFVLGVGWSETASAFCRTTTCQTCVQPDEGCVEEGTKLFWPGSCITYDVNQNGSQWATYEETKAAADLAFHAWQSATVTCDGAGVNPTFELQNLGPVACDRHEYNDQSKTFGGNANIVVFHDGDWPEADQAGPGLIALTTVSFEVSSGQIFDADIEINGQNRISPVTPDPTSYDLQSILTHEAGHFFGLAHAIESCSAVGGDCPTMTRQYPRGSDAFRTLEADDIAGICAIYPANRAVSDSACVPRHGFASTCGTTDKPAGCCAVAPGARSRPRAEAVLAGLVGLAVFLLRRRRG